VTAAPLLSVQVVESTISTGGCAEARPLRDGAAIGQYSPDNTHDPKDRKVLDSKGYIPKVPKRTLHRPERFMAPDSGTVPYA